MKKLSSFKEKMQPSKKINKKGGKQVKGIDYAIKLEKSDSKDQYMDNHPKKKPLDIAEALRKSKMGYSKKPRVKPSKKMGKP